MHLKFLAHGKGSGLEAAKYLLSETDHKGNEWSGITVLRGNPEQVAAVIDSLEFANRYTSGVIAWGPADNPGKGAISSVLDDFEKLAFSGLEPDRYSWTVIQHDEAVAMFTSSPLVSIYRQENHSTLLHPVGRKILIVCVIYTI